MTTATTQFPTARPFTLEECAALVAAGIIAEGEQAAVLAGKRLFTAEEYLAMIEASILQKEERIELIDGEIIIMSPIGEYHEYGTDHLTMELAPILRGRAIVRVQGSIRLHDRSRPEPDVAVLHMRPPDEMGPYFPSDVYFLIEVADSSLQRDSGPKLAMYAAAGIPEVWVANLRAREVMVFTNPSASGYATVHTYRAGDNISLGAFPEISLVVDDFMPPAPSPDVEVA